VLLFYPQFFDDAGRQSYARNAAQPTLWLNFIILRAWKGGFVETAIVDYT